MVFYFKLANGFIPEVKMFEKNIRALSARNPGLVQKLINHSTVGIDFDQSQSGDYNLIYNGIHLHDTTDPQLEAKLAYGEDYNRKNSLKIVFGLGLGYLFKRTYIEFNGYIVVFEPVLDVLKATLQAVDFSSEIEDKRIFIVNDISDLKSVFYTYICEHVSIVHLNSYKAMFPELYDATYYELNKHFLDQQTNLNKAIQISEAFVNNLPYVVKSPSITLLTNKIKNKPALVIAAGPSLDKCIDIIKANRNKFAIISIGQALKALIKEDIWPDFVVIIDMLPLIHQIDFLGNETNKLNLVLKPSVDTEFFKINSNTRFVYLSHPDYISEWYAKRAGYSTLPQGCTVAINAFCVAKSLGANPIILVGQDLAYSNGKIYASNSIYDTVSYTVSDNGNLKVTVKPEDDSKSSISKANLLNANIQGYEKVITVKGQNGEDLYTNNGYASFISHYTEFATKYKQEDPSLRLINSSEGGAYIQGFDHIPLKDVLNDMLDLDIDLNTIITTEYALKKFDAAKIAQINVSFNRLMADLRTMKDDSLRAIKLGNRIKNELEINSFINNKLLDAYKRLQKLENTLKKYNVGDRVSFIYPFIQKELFEYNSVKDQKGNTDIEKILIVVDTVIKFAETMIIAAERTLKNFENLEGFPFKE